LTVPVPGGRIAGMFRSKRNKQEAPKAETESRPVNSGGYQVTELPTFHGRTRKVVVYTSDASGKIIKTFKK
jgi:hypothetical protein